MSGQYNKIALVPAYKPDGTLLEVIRGLTDNGFEVVVVNDGSGSEYDNVFDKASESAEVLSFDVNRGKGEALKSGKKYIRDTFKPPYIVLTIDSDGQHRVKDALRIVDCACENPDDLVIGKRNLKLKGTPLRSKVGNNITHFGFRQATLTHLNETQTGLRAFSDRIIDKVVDAKGSRYEYEMIVLMTLSRLGVRIHEVEIETVYEDGNSSSHFNPFPDSVRIYWSILKFAWPAMLCFLIDLAVFVVCFIRTSGPELWLMRDFSNMSLLNMIFISNVTARTVSTVCDIIINKRVLFRNSKSKCKVVILYILLLLAVFAIDTALVSGFAFIGVIPYIGKVLTMLLITWLSRIIQAKIFEL
ncbi:MAG: glycosyltransferase family 2 protein [Ruminococcus sp.]|nr:glycosyltransferase family 2 protein [Ruminococcus sp.]